MRFRSYLYLIAVFLLFGSFVSIPPETKTVVFCWTYKFSQGKILFIPYNRFGTSHLNDSLKKYLHNNGSTVTKIYVAQPSLVIDSIDFKLFPNLTELTLSVGDEDVLENRKYNFLSANKLKRININLVYIQVPGGIVDYRLKEKNRFRDYIHQYRPDIKVRWPRQYGYELMWEQEGIFR